MSGDYYDLYARFSRATALDEPKAAWTNRKKLVYYCRRTFCFSCILLAVILTSLDVIFRQHFDLTEVSSNLMDISIYICSLIRFAFTVIKRDEIKTIIGNMNGFKRTADNKFERLEMSSSANLARLVQIAWIVFATGAIVGINVPYIYQRIIHGQRHLVTPMFTYYDHTVSPCYELTLVYGMSTQLIHAFVYINLDIFFFTTVVLLNRQFEILASDFRNLMFEASEDEVEDDRRSVKSAQSLQRALSARVLHHQALLDVIAKLESCLSLPCFLQCLFSTTYIMFGMFLIVISDDKAETMNAACYLYGSFVQICFMSIFGQMLSNKAEILSQALYATPWYANPDKGFRLSLLILQANLQRTVKISAGKFFDLSHATLVAILQTSFTYFTVLREVTGNN